MKSKKSKYSTKVFSTMITMLVIGLLLFAGPARAVTLEISDISDSTPNKGEDITIELTIDISDPERVPDEDSVVVLDLTPSDDTNDAISCEFDVNGTIIDVNDCPGIEVDMDTDLTYGYGYNNLDSDDFGYGYGYGDEGVITYTITLDTDELEIDTYDVDFTLENGAETYEASSDEITVSRESTNGGSDNDNEETTPAPKETFILVNLEEGSHTLDVDNDLLPVYGIKFDLLEPESSTRFEVSNVPPQQEYSGTVYAYISIEHSVLDDNLGGVKLQFKVPKSWMAGKDKNSIVLSRYTDAWSDLVTTFVKEDSEYYYYEASSPGLSSFAVVYKAVVSTPPSQDVTPPATIPQTGAETTGQAQGTGGDLSTTPPAQQGGESTTSKKSHGSFWLWAIIIIIAGAIIAAIVVETKRRNRYK